MREVFEEVGYDCSDEVDAEEYLEMQWQQQVGTAGLVGWGETNSSRWPLFSSLLRGRSSGVARLVWTHAE